jgi:hypothetical protein
VAEEHVSGVRPYLITGGRARPVDALRLEAQVLSTWEGRTAIARLVYEHRDVVALCLRPLAVAEVAAKLGLHLGVARVLVGDLVAMGYLTVSDRDPRQQDQVRIIERVIDGLSAKR